LHQAERRCDHGLRSDELGVFMSKWLSAEERGSYCCEKGKCEHDPANWFRIQNKRQLKKDVAHIPEQGSIDGARDGIIEYLRKNSWSVFD
jgi:hypothetical protein